MNSHISLGHTSRTSKIREWTQMDFKKEDWKFVVWAIVMIIGFLLLILAPKPFWLDGGGFVWR